MNVLGETIRLTVLPGAGVAFADFDVNRALAAMGFKPKMPGRKMTTKSRIEKEFLQNRGIRDLEHYRQIVKDPLSIGPVHWYSPGESVLMHRTIKPKRETVYYLILDTAIGAREDFIQELVTEKRVTISQAQI